MEGEGRNDGATQIIFVAGVHFERLVGEAGIDGFLTLADNLAKLAQRAVLEKLFSSNPMGGQLVLSTLVVFEV